MNIVYQLFLLNQIWSCQKNKKKKGKRREIQNSENDARNFTKIEKSVKNSKFP